MSRDIQVRTFESIRKQLEREQMSLQRTYNARCKDSRAHYLYASCNGYNRALEE